jgi:hypothetical protein
MKGLFMLKALSFFSSIASMIVVAYADGNLGNVTSLRIMTGYDNNRYIEVGHNGTNLQSNGTDFPNAPSSWSDPVYLAWPTDEMVNVSVWSMLQKALTCQCIQFNAIKGNYDIGYVFPGPTPYVYVRDYKFISQ